MDIYVQSFLNSATKLTIAVNTTTTVAQLKALVNTAEGTTSTYMEFYLVNTATTTATVFANGNTLGSYGVVDTGTYINSSNTISTSTNKTDRQVAKLELAKLRRQAAGDTSANYYREYNVYDIDLLADKYTSNTATIGTTSTLVDSRPWGSLIADLMLENGDGLITEDGNTIITE
jgi:hypothetical protein